MAKAEKTEANALSSGAADDMPPHSAYVASLHTDNFADVSKVTFIALIVSIDKKRCFK